ncbi:MAG: hypothetical protein JSW54_05720 [Fidelibacterota bacterium]|nr:MAG: hypothetical protein JSW54_05720 [Candidatus Neomarinimicrobiota bacterium]
MKEQSTDALDLLFRHAKAELPPGLKTRLLAIPQTIPAGSFWDVRWILPLASLIPSGIWLILTRLGAFWRLVADRVIAPVRDLSLPAIPAPSLLSLGIILVVAMTTFVFLTWLYLRTENQAATVYAQRLTRAH